MTPFTSWTATLSINTKLPKQEREDAIVAWIQAEFEQRHVDPAEVGFLGMVHGPSEISARVPGPLELAIANHAEKISDVMVAYPMQRFSIADTHDAGLSKVENAFRISGRFTALVCWYGADEFELRLVTARA
jgi:hypothetical protein